MLKYIEQSGYIYHYYFSIDDKKAKNKSSKIYLWKEKYEYGTNATVDLENKDTSKFYYIIYNKRSNKRVRQDQIGKLMHGKWILLLERNDDLAKQLYNDYIAQKIKEENAKIKALKDKQSLVNNLNIEE